MSCSPYQNILKKSVEVIKDKLYFYSHKDAPDQDDKELSKKVKIINVDQVCFPPFIC